MDTPTLKPRTLTVLTIVLNDHHDASLRLIESKGIEILPDVGQQNQTPTS